MLLVWCLSNLLTTVIKTQTFMVCLLLPFLQPWLESVLSGILQQNGISEAPPVQLTLVSHQKLKVRQGVGKGEMSFFMLAELYSK